MGHAIRPGLFKVKIVKGAPWIPAVIYRPCPFEMFVDEPWNMLDRWPPLLAARDTDSFGRLKESCDPFWVWVHGEEISALEFKFWMDTRRHIKLHEPDAIDADPRRKIDLSQMAPRGPRKR